MKKDFRESLVTYNFYIIISLGFFLKKYDFLFF